MREVEEGSFSPEDAVPQSPGCGAWVCRAPGRPLCEGHLRGDALEGLPVCEARCLRGWPSRRVGSPQSRDCDSLGKEKNSSRPEPSRGPLLAGLSSDLSLASPLTGTVPHSKSLSAHVCTACHTSVCVGRCGSSEGRGRVPAEKSSGPDDLTGESCQAPDKDPAAPSHIPPKQGRWELPVYSPARPPATERPPQEEDAEDCLREVLTIPWSSSAAGVRHPSGRGIPGRQGGLTNQSP